MLHYFMKIDFDVFLFNKITDNLSLIAILFCTNDDIISYILTLLDFIFLELIYFTT